MFKTKPSHPIVYRLLSRLVDRLMKLSHVVNKRAFPEGTCVCLGNGRFFGIVNWRDGEVSHRIPIRGNDGLVFYHNAAIVRRSERQGSHVGFIQTTR